MFTLVVADASICSSSASGMSLNSACSSRHPGEWTIDIWDDDGASFSPSSPSWSSPLRSRSKPMLVKSSGNAKSAFTPTVKPHSKQHPRELLKHPPVSSHRTSLHIAAFSSGELSTPSTLRMTCTRTPALARASAM